MSALQLFSLPFSISGQLLIFNGNVNGLENHKLWKIDFGDIRKLSGKMTFACVGEQQEHFHAVFEGYGWCLLNWRLYYWVRFVVSLLKWAKSEYSEENGATSSSLIKQSGFILFTLESGLCLSLLATFGSGHSESHQWGILKYLL